MNGRHGIRVRGRDFTGYRIAGAIVALIFLVFLIWQLVYLFQGYKVVVPQVGWETSSTVTGIEDSLSAPASGSLATAVLRDRTTLMEGRENVGPAPGLTPPPMALDYAGLLDTRRLHLRDRTLPRSWSIPDDVARQIMRPSEKVIGWTAAPYTNAALFERPEGRTWRHAMADWAQHYGALAILGIVLLLGLFLAIRGRVPIAEGRDGRTVLRFDFLERSVHWLVAGSFVLLALSGAVIAFGTTLIAPLFGVRALGSVAWVSAWGHMMFALPFTIGIIVMFVMWVLRNLPEPRVDGPWLSRLGGFLSDSGDNPPARKFNAGQKGTFWIATIGGAAMIGTGITLMFPYVWADLSGMVWVMFAHAIIGLSLIAFFIAHAYIGTAGMEDAFAAMWSGHVDLNWAREHHQLWLEELDRKGQLPDDFRWERAELPERGRRDLPPSAYPEEV